jgi:hypothetical protein
VIRYSYVREFLVRPSAETEYAALDRECENLTTHETSLAEFSE